MPVKLWIRLVLATFCFSFQFDCSGEQDVVFQMDVLVQIRLKIVKSSEKLKASRTPGSVSQVRPYAAEQGSCILVLMLHRCDRVPYSSKARVGNSCRTLLRLLKLLNVRK